MSSLALDKGRASGFQVYLYFAAVPRQARGTLVMNWLKVSFIRSTLQGSSSERHDTHFCRGFSEISIQELLV